MVAQGDYVREERARRLVGRLGRKKRTQRNGEGFWRSGVRNGFVVTKRHERLGRKIDQDQSMWRVAAKDVLRC